MTPSLADLHAQMMAELARTQSAAAAKRSNEMAELNRLIDADKNEMWVIEGFEKFKGRLVGNGQCPQIVQIHGHVPKTKYWLAGPKVQGNAHLIPYGTAIATFVNGVYPNDAHDNHTAIFIRETFEYYSKEKQFKTGIQVFDQWTDKEGGAGYRFMPYNSPKHGRSNDGSAFSILLTRKPMWPTGTRIPVR